MTDVDRSLRETLSSGASRVFNVAEISRRLLEMEAPERLFATRGLNNAVHQASEGRDITERRGGCSNDR